MSKSKIHCICRKESRFCPCTETEIEAKLNELEMEIKLPIKSENELEKNREMEVNGVVYRMLSTIATIVDQKENHYMIVRDTRSIQRKASLKKQVYEEIHLWIKDLDF